jgi:hypothetical protein
LGGSVHTIKKNAEGLIVASMETGLEVNAAKLSAWSCLEIRLHDEVTLCRWRIDPLKWWKSSNIWEKL